MEFINVIFTIEHIKNNDISKFGAYKTGSIKTDNDFHNIYKYLETPNKKKKIKK